MGSAAKARAAGKAMDKISNPMSLNLNPSLHTPKQALVYHKCNAQLSSNHSEVNAQYLELSKTRSTQFSDFEVAPRAFSTSARGSAGLGSGDDLRIAAALCFTPDDSGTAFERAEQRALQRLRGAEEEGFEWRWLTEERKRWGERLIAIGEAAQRVASTETQNQHECGLQAQDS